MLTADFELLLGLAGVVFPCPVEGENYISLRVKVVDLSEVGGDPQRSCRAMQVMDVGVAEAEESQRA